MENVDEKLDFWLSQYPHSGHPLDQERFYKFIDAVVDYDDHLSPVWFRKQLETRTHPLNEQEVNRLVALFDTIVGYGKHVRGLATSLQP